MRLRTFESFWLLQNGLIKSYPSLQEDLSCQTLVIGGGVTGALISHALIAAGHEVVLIDRRDIGQGSTSATTSMLQYEIDTQLIDLAGMIGEDHAALCYRAGIKAIDTLGRLIEEEQIDCGFEWKKSLYLPHDEQSLAKLQKEYACRDKHQLGVEWLDSAAIAQRWGVAAKGGILSGKAASVDAYRLAHGLIAKNRQRGLRVFDQTELSNFQADAAGVSFSASGGHTVRAGQVVFCSGFETLSLFKKRYARIVSTFACISEPDIAVQPELFDTLVWDTNDPYIYLRTTEDHRLLIGGEDTKFNSGKYREGMKRRKSEKLIKKLGALIPGINFIEDFNWAGAFGITKDGLPYIGKHPDFPHAVFVLGLGGNGITFSVQGMDLALKALSDEEDILLTLYRFDR